jgi:hypothetical protein
MPDASDVMDGSLVSAHFHDPRDLVAVSTSIHALDDSTTWGRRLVRRIDLTEAAVTAVVEADTDRGRLDGVDTDAGLFMPSYMAYDAAGEHRLIFDPDEGVFQRGVAAAVTAPSFPWSTASCRRRARQPGRRRRSPAYSPCTDDR